MAEDRDVRISIDELITLYAALRRYAVDHDKNAQFLSLPLVRIALSSRGLALPDMELLLEARRRARHDLSVANGKIAELEQLAAAKK
jgi:hypothetical protein